MDATWNAILLTIRWTIIAALLLVPTARSRELLYRYTWKPQH